MSSEFFTSSMSPTEQVHGLVERRKALSEALGGLSVILNEVTRQYNACIGDIVRTNTALTAMGVDTDALARSLQDASHDSADMDGEPS